VVFLKVYWISYYTYLLYTRLFSY